MFTQCPECATAFRVTADVLRQAAGKVRCGGCGSAFNALMYLSETRPEKPARPGDEDLALPELRPEDEGRERSAGEPPPRAMSPDASEALLETLDELSGENIRLEDTGIEWRVLPESGDESGVGTRPADAGTDAASIDEVLEDSPTPVDEFLTASPHDLDAPEVFEANSDMPAGSFEAREVFEHAAGEMRFDDNTGLPDDFDLEEDDLPAGPAPDPEPAESRTEVQPDALRIDIAFGEPEEWEALLGEVEQATPPIESADDGSAGNADVEAAVAGDGSGEPLDLDTQFGLQAEALGIDTGSLEALEETGTEGAGQEETTVLHDAGTSDDADGPDPDTTDATSGSTPDMSAAGREADETESDEALPGRGDADAGPAIGERPSAQADEDDDAGLEEQLYTADVDFEFDDTDIPVTFSSDDTRSERIHARAETEGREGDDPAVEESLDDSLEALLEPDFDDLGADEEKMPSAVHDLERELHGDEATAADDDGFDLVAGDDDSEPPAILPMSEEEQTINQMIDEDMLRMAVEEDDGLSSSMVLRAEDVESALAEGAEQAAAEEETAEEHGVGVETIIMEGEFIRTALEEEALKEQAAEEDEETPADEAEGHSGENRLVSAFKSTMHGRTREDDAPGETRRRRGLVAGVGVLTFLLIAQIVHQSRAELATIPALNGIIAPIYRTLGAPITPAWDVTGWRFEVTRGSTNAATLADELAEDGRGVDLGEPTDAGPEVLTIYSRIGNQAPEALPYPLVSVSLTDRFEEVIGSKVLSPNEYLTGDFDPRQLVPPGETFNAVITIDSPDAQATGFKLNVCYREAGGNLRCAIEDFL